VAYWAAQSIIDRVSAVETLREVTLGIYSDETPARLERVYNPITPAEAAAAEAAVDLVDSEEGLALLKHLRAMTARFEQGLSALGCETIPGAHPVVPLMVRDSARTAALVAHLRSHGILATGLNYPVVPRGDEEIRFQIAADHSAADIDEALAVLADFLTGKP
jgi:glycine C-acetyltransferase